MTMFLGFAFYVAGVVVWITTQQVDVSAFLCGMATAFHISYWITK